jgi:hypothetical protein
VAISRRRMLKESPTPRDHKGEGGPILPAFGRETPGGLARAASQKMRIFFFPGG